MDTQIISTTWATIIKNPWITRKLSRKDIAIVMSYKKLRLALEYAEGFVEEEELDALKSQKERLIKSLSLSKSFMRDIPEDMLEEFKELQKEELNKYHENQKSSLLDEIKSLENFSPLDFESSALWSFHHCLLLVEKLLNERQREEWVGDLEEALYKMYELKYPRWRLHIETLRRTFYILKGVFIIKLNALPYKRKSSK